MGVVEPYIIQNTPDELLDVERHIKFVMKIAERLGNYLPQSICFDDLVQEGMLALLEIYNNYNGATGVTVEAFATLRVRGAMIDLLRRSMPLSKEKIFLIRKSHRFIEGYQHSYEYRPKEYLVAEHLGVSLEKYRSLLVDYEGCISSNIDECNDIETTDNYLDHLITKKILINSMRKLSERERNVITLYYIEELTLAEIGTRLTLSESRVSQINKLATNKLRRMLKALYN